MKKTFKLRNVIVVAICLAGFMLSGCGNNPPELPTLTVESIALNKTTLTLAVGEFETLVATTVPADVAVTWTSSSENATINANGKVTGEVEGTTIITATAGDKTTICTVTIRGVLINGVVWAAHNVDMPGTFATISESTGMFYQWNRRVGWNATDPNGGTTWDSSVSTSATWEIVNDPSPAGWRVPTIEELETLCDETKVTSERTSQRGIGGRKFTDKTTGVSIFLPAAGYRASNAGALYSNIAGYYWSSTENNASAHFVYFNGERQDTGNAIKSSGFSIRCVAE